MMCNRATEIDMNTLSHCTRPITSGLLRLVLVLAASTYASAAPAQALDPEATFLRVTNLTPGHVLWVHAGPSMRFQHIGFFRYNDRHIHSYGCGAIWCEVDYQGKRGWASKRYLTDDSARQV